MWRHFRNDNFTLFLVAMLVLLGVVVAIIRVLGYEGRHAAWRGIKPC
jgi:hypothetical protein